MTARPTACFVCGPDNATGLQLRFRLENGDCVARFTPGDRHVGFPGVVHGGLIYCALDDAMANWLYFRGARAYTARCRVRYRSAVAPGDSLRLVGRATGRKRRIFEMEATATRESDGVVVAAATAAFVVLDETEFAPLDAQWTVGELADGSRRSAGPPVPCGGERDSGPGSDR